MTAVAILEKSPDQFAKWVAALTDDKAIRFWHDWRNWARPEQLAPAGDWRVWLMMAGRGFGKTRAGAEWVREQALARPGARIALVATTPAEARSIMVEGVSGLLAIGMPEERPQFESSLKRLVWANGSVATLFGASDPESLRGPEHDVAWCDEIGKWPDSENAWDNLLLTLRRGNDPRVVATTTPRGGALLRRLVREAAVHVTRGASVANADHMAPGWLAALQRLFGGTRQGRQELDGELLEDHDGALWTRERLEACRVDAGSIGVPVRVVVGVDPPAGGGADGDACGIIVAGELRDGRLAVLEDASVRGLSPAGWAHAVCAAAARWNADRVVAERNQGGAMVEATLLIADPMLPVTMVWASAGKAARAEPVSLRYERGEVVHAGAFAALEDELCGLVMGGGYAGPSKGSGSKSPDRADACVWALTVLGEGQRRGRGVGVRVV